MDTFRLQTDTFISSLLTEVALRDFPTFPFPARGALTLVGMYRPTRRRAVVAAQGGQVLLSAPLFSQPGFLLIYLLHLLEEGVTVYDLTMEGA